MRVVVTGAGGFGYGTTCSGKSACAEASRSHSCA